jgi:hypothetical protein
MKGTLSAENLTDIADADGVGAIAALTLGDAIGAIGALASWVGDGLGDTALAVGAVLEAAFGVAASGATTFAACLSLVL